MSSKSKKFKFLMLLGFGFTLPPWIILTLIRLISERPTSLDQNGVIAEFIFYNFPLFLALITLLLSVLKKRLIYGLISGFVIALVLFVNHSLFNSYRHQYFRYNGWRITGYEIIDRGVFYKTYPVVGADPETFENMKTEKARRNYFWKDKDHVYLRGSRFHNADPESFIVSSNNLARDRSNLYFSYHWEFRHGDVIPNIDFNTLEFHSEGSLCFRDKNGVYLGPRKIDFDPSFRWLKCHGSNALGIVTDKLVEIEFRDYNLPAIENIHETPFTGNSETARFSKDYRLLRDDSHIYLFNSKSGAYEKVDDIDPDSLEKIGTFRFARSYYRSKDRVFFFDYYSKIKEGLKISGVDYKIIRIENINPKTFTVVDESFGYDATDGNRYFRKGIEVSKEEIEAKRKEYEDDNDKRRNRHKRKKSKGK